jgi:hypothetical protein
MSTAAEKLSRADVPLVPALAEFPHSSGTLFMFITDIEQQVTI